MLTANEFAVLREHQTVRAFARAGCELPLYRSENKYDGCTGWPSFAEAIKGAVATMPDRTLIFLVRTEVHCARCKGYQDDGLVDGPPPFGNRHCINGTALIFVPDRT